MASSSPNMPPEERRVVRRSSPGKINLRLKVTARRADGYHELETLFIPLQTPCDTVAVSFDGEPGIRVTADHPDLPCDAGNICWKAAEQYCRRGGIVPDFAIHIEKVIPVAAGLGGGSANAAAVLLILQERFRALSADELAAMAVAIGADVPFFLHARPAVATGVGEKLTFLDFDASRIPLVIAAPDFPVSAAWAYRNLAASRIGCGDGLDDMIAALKTDDWEKCARYVCNDLAFALYEKFPLLTLLRQTFIEAGALAAEISGSGPSMFAVFPDHAAAAVGAAVIDEVFEKRVRTFIATS